ncbi:hypothetical protein LBMAG53_11870 [Planctomycetota bacterium]|nr:hypothetical protein LBMAG53_11870 [Planctomycetota bacterium]
MTKAFTLAEVLVSIGILSVISTVMLLSLSTATRLYRVGEYSRAANDEAVTVLSALEADFDRMLPPALPVMDANGVLQPGKGGGWIYAKVFKSGTDSLGNCLLAFTIRNPDRDQVTADGKYANLAVAWWVDKNGTLYREAKLLPGDDAGDENVKTGLRNIAETSSPQDNIVTTNCLHFGAWIAIQELASMTKTEADGGWEAPNTNDPTKTKLPPRMGGDVLDTAPPPPSLYYGPFPSAIRVSLCLAGPSRYRPLGKLRDDIDLTAGEPGKPPIRVSGLSNIPAQGFLLFGNLGNAASGEWVKIKSAQAGGKVEVDRAARRSTAKNHPAGTAVSFGTEWSLVRTIPK